MGVDRQLLVSSPRPRTLTGTFLGVAQAGGASASSRPPRRLERASRSARLTGWVLRPEHLERHRHLLVRPAQLAHPHVDRRLAALEAVRCFAPARDPSPFWPRPEVLPGPEPSPRPTRLRPLREPGAGLRLWRPSRLGARSPPGGSRLLLDHHEMADRVDHAAQLRGVGPLDDLPILRSPSERSVSRWRALAPFDGASPCLIT